VVTKVSERAKKILRETQTPYLATEEREVLARFIAHLEAECGDEIRRVILFGSKARGDADEESDVDVLIVAKDGVERVRRVADEFDVESDIVLLPIVFSEEKYSYFQRLKLPLYVNIRRDGMELWDPLAWETEEREFPLDFVEGEFRKMDKNTRGAIQDYLTITENFWRLAMYDKQGGFLEGAVSRAFYAAFHAASAALFAVNVVRGKHSGVEAALSQFLVKPGLFEREYKDIYTRLMKGRIVTDYGGERDERGVPEFKKLSEGEMEQMLVDAERFIARMKRFLRERGAID
jgi:uncharacterized protein (UPF0332 family)/predicted nucleotidyltransferase